MKTVKLIIEDKEIEVQISDEQFAELTKPKKVTGFERAKHNEKLYYTVSSNGTVGNPSDTTISDEQRYKIANYYTSKELAEWCCRSDNLNRQMRRWAAEHNIYPLDWYDSGAICCHIMYDSKNRSLVVHHSAYGHFPEAVYFSTEEVAEQAIEEFGDEIKWLAENRPKWF